MSGPRTACSTVVRTVRRSLAAALVAASLASLPACGGDDLSDDPADVGATVTTAASAGGSATTVDDGDDEPTIVGDACTALVAGLASAGLTGGDGATVSAGAAGVQGQCSWFEAAGDYRPKLTVTLTGGADSAAFEDALANPTFGDPAEVPDLGTMAAIAEVSVSDADWPSGSRHLVVLTDDTLVHLVSDPALVERDGLVELGGGVIAALP